MSNVYGYRNIVTGDAYITGAERPDLEARPNFERYDVDDDEIPEALRDQLAAEANTATVLLESARTTENAQREYLEDQQLGTGVEVLEPGEPASFVAQPGVRGAAGGVLSRNAPRGLSQAVAKAQSAADTEAIAYHGVLADQVDGDNERVDAEHIAHGLVVKNAKPVGDTKDSPARKKAAAVKKTEQAAARKREHGTPATPGTAAPAAGHAGQSGKA